MIKSPSDLSLSSSESYQSLTNLTIKCCICLEEVNNENSYMSECKHSWCKECNENLNKYYINKCPICKSKFNSILKYGRWKYTPSHFGGTWKWEIGENDTKYKRKMKKIQQFFYNLITPISQFDNHSIGI